MGKEPDRFKFKDNVAMVSAGENEVKDVIRYFREWLPLANRVYSARIRREIEEENRKQENNLKAEIARKEQRARVLEKIKEII